MSELKEYRRAVDLLMERYSHYRQQITSEKAGLATAREDLDAATEAQVRLQLIAQAIQQNAHDQIAKVVSRCLEFVFDDPYEFRIVFEKKRGKTEARLTFVRDGVEIHPLKAAGGGPVDIAAFGLRLATLVLAKPRARLVLVLDEPFRFVSPQYRRRVRLMLETLAKEMGVQFVIVTHMEELKIGTLVELE